MILTGLKREDWGSDEHGPYLSYVPMAQGRCDWCAAVCAIKDEAGRDARLGDALLEALKAVGWVDYVDPEPPGGNWTGDRPDRRHFCSRKCRKAYRDDQKAYRDARDHVKQKEKEA